MRLRYDAVALTLLSLGLANGVEAQDATPRTSSLSWVRMPGAESCISGRDLARAVEARLGRGVFVSAAQAEVAVEGRIEQASEGARASPSSRWRASVTMSDASGAVLGRREIASAEASCHALDAPLALVLAVMIDPDASARTEQQAAPAQVEPARASMPAPAPAPAPPRVIVRERVVVREAPSRTPPEPWRVDAEAGVALLLGAVPGAGVGALVSATLEPPGFWQLVADGLITLPSRADVRGGVGGADVWLALGGLSLCPVYGRVSRVGLAACAGVQVGTVRVEPVDLAAPADQEQLLVNLAARALARWRIAGPLVVRAAVLLAVPFVRDEFTYRQGDGTERPLFRMSPLAGGLELALGVQVP